MRILCVFALGLALASMAAAQTKIAGTDASTRDGKPESTAGTWSYTGGSGKFKGITGKGTYKGKVDASGNMVTDVEGDYTLPAKK